MNNIEVKKIREKLGLTQEELAEKLEVHLRTVQKWEGGETKIRKGNALMLTELLKKHTKGANKNQETYTPEGRVIGEDEYFKKKTYVIPVTGRGGLENEMYDPITFNDLEIEETTVKQQSHNGSTYFKIEVAGISMDDGSKFSLAEGDWAYCRSIPKKYWKTKFHTNKYEIFCFFHNQRGITFKKIKSQNVDEGILTLTSLHPDKDKFPDFEVSIYECSYICNVIRVVTDF